MTQVRAVRSWRARATALAMIAFPGCRSLEREVVDDRAAVEQLLRARADAPLPGAWAQDEELPAAALALLADGVTVDTAVTLAFACHPGLAAELERLGVARATLRQAALPDSPLLSANWKFFSGPDEIELSLTQSFLGLLFLASREQAAAGERAAVEAEVVAALVHHAYAVRRAHATACHAAAQRRLARAGEAAAMASAELMEGLQAAGSVTDELRTLAAIGAVQASDEEAAASAADVAARHELAELLGLPASAPEWELRESAGRAADGAPTTAPDHELVATAVANSLALAAARGRIDAAAARAGIEPAASFLRSAEIGVAAKHDASDEWGLGPLVTVPLPLFDLGGNAAGASAAELRRQELLARALARELVRATQLAAATARSWAARERTARERDLPLHAQLVREVVQRYNAMQIGAFDVFEARERELAAQQRAARFALAATLAQIDLAELLAGGWPARDASSDAAARALEH